MTYDVTVLQKRLEGLYQIVHALRGNLDEARNIATLYRIRLHAAGLDETIGGKTDRPDAVCPLPASPRRNDKAAP
jgi:hypothetical protein